MDQGASHDVRLSPAMSIKFIVNFIELRRPIVSGTRCRALEYLGIAAAIGFDSCEPIRSLAEE